MVKLKDFNIGHDDGEQEAADSVFVDLFYTDNDSYNSILDKDKFIIKGKKGTGKTLLAEYVKTKHNKKNQMCEIFKMTDIHEQMIKDSNVNMKNEEFKKEDLAASFLGKVVDILCKKTLKAAKDKNVKTIILAGGVAANSLLRSQLTEQGAKLGIKVYALPDGDVAGSILTCIVDSDVDMLYGIGGAPEGVISAAVIRALGGDMQARLKLRSEVKGVTLENDKISNFEKSRCESMGLTVGQVLTMNDLVKDDEVIFSATGITGGDLLEGIKRKGSIARTQTLVVRGKSKTVRYINSVHNLDFKDAKITHLVK